MQLAQIVIRSGTSYADYLSDAATLLNTAMHVDPNEVYSSSFVIFELKIPTVIQTLCLFITVNNSLLISNNFYENQKAYSMISG